MIQQILTSLSSKLISSPKSSAKSMSRDRKVMASTNPRILQEFWHPVIPQMNSKAF